MLHSCLRKMLPPQSVGLLRRYNKKKLICYQRLRHRLQAIGCSNGEFCLLLPLRAFFNFGRRPLNSPFFDFGSRQHSLSCKNVVPSTTFRSNLVVFCSRRLQIVDRHTSATTSVRLHRFQQPTTRTTQWKRKMMTALKSLLLSPVQ